MSEVVVNDGESHVQAIIANRVIEWSRENRVQLNADKCKELRISFAKEQTVRSGHHRRKGGRVSHYYKATRPYNSERTKKASKRLYSLTQLFYVFRA